MKRSECTAERIKFDGWFCCYHENSNKQFTYEEIENAIKSGAKIEKEINTLTRNVYIKINNAVMMFRPASEEEIKSQKETEEEAYYKRAIEKIDRRNRVRIKKRR